MLPILHKINVISRIVLIRRYGIYSRMQSQQPRPSLPGHQANAASFHSSQSQSAQLSNEPVVDVMQKLESNPQAMVAVTKFLQVAHSEGFNETLMSGRMPSRMELLKLYSNPNMRKAAEEMMVAFSEAGIQFDQETAMKLVKNLPELPGGLPEDKS